MKHLHHLSLSWVGFIVVILYLIYAALTLKPDTYRYFSLIDDGQSLHNYYALKDCVLESDCSGAQALLIEKEFGRFRPGYWIINSLFFMFGQANPVTIHLLRILLLGSALCLLICASVFTVTRSFLGAVISSIIFYASISFTENMVRIGPAEPYQLLMVAAFSLTFLHFKKISKVLSPLVTTVLMVLLLLLACLVKETTVALLPVLVFFFIFYRTHLPLGTWLSLLLPFVSIILGKVISQPDSNVTNYGSFYSVNPQNIVATLVAYSQIVVNTVKWFLPLCAGFASLVLFRQTEIKQPKALIYWLLLGLSFFAILLPWRFVLDRYLLIVFFTVAVLIGSVYELLLQKCISVAIRILYTTPYRRFSSLIPIVLSLVMLVICSNIFVLSMALQLGKSKNYASWYSEYLRYEHTLVKALADAPGLVHLNGLDTLDNWEVLYELPLHLDYFYGQSGKLTLAPKNLDGVDILLQTTSLAPNPDVSEMILTKGQIIDQNRVEVPQLDLIAFRQDLRYKPLQTLLNPPVADEKITHQWQLYEVRSR